MVKAKAKVNSFDSEGAKERLALMKSAQEIRFHSNADKKSKKVALEMVKEQQRRVEGEEKIRRLEKKIKEKSFIGRLKKGVEKAIDKGLKKKVVSKKILKPSNIRVRIKEYKAPSVLSDPNRFFKNEWEETKKELFFK